MSCWIVLRLHKEREVFEDAKDDTLFHVSNLFNPIRLFHLFLLEASFGHLDPPSLPLIIAYILELIFHLE